MAIQKTCEYCNKPFLALKNRTKFCSHACEGLRKRKQWFSGTCPNCSKEFSLPRKAIYCSQACLVEYGQKTHTRKCAVCDKEFYNVKLSNIYCSSECSGKAKIKERHKTTCKECGKDFESKLPKISYAALGRPLPTFCSKICLNKYRYKKITITCIICQTERKISPSTAKYSAAKFCSPKCVSTYYSGERCPLYVNGNTSLKDKIRKSPEYTAWKLAVFYRDGKKCVWCGSRKNIEADHIKPQSLYPELRFDVDNGRTLCNPCHRTTPSYMRRFNSREEYETAIIAT